MNITLDLSDREIVLLKGALLKEANHFELLRERSIERNVGDPERYKLNRLLCIQIHDHVALAAHDAAEDASALARSHRMLNA
jgi:hypothetical protein